MKPRAGSRAVLLLIMAVVASASAQSTAVVPYPRDYTSRLVRYAVVDRSDGMSRDLYVSREAVDALKHDPRLKEFPAGVLFALDVHSARTVGLEPKTGAPRFEVTREGRLVRSKNERTLHLMEKVRPGFGSHNWAFGGFDPVTAEPLKLQLPGDCLLCHQAAVMSEMTFSLNLLRRFVTSGSVQYRLCQQPGRQPCPFQ